MIAHDAEPGDAPDVMGYAEAARYLGISEGHLRREAGMLKRVPFAKLGRRVIFSRAALAEWLTERARESVRRPSRKTA